MADFLQNLRMSGIFNGPQPFGMPDFNSGSDPNLMNNLFSRLDSANYFRKNLIEQDRQKQRDDEVRNNLNASIGQPYGRPALNSIADMQAGAAQHPGEIQPGMNYRVDQSAASNENPIDVFQGITPLQRGQMDIQRAALAQKEADSGTKEELAKSKLEIDRSKVGISQQRADVYKFKSEHPGMKFQITKGGNFVAEDPITGKVIDSGVDTGTMSDQDKQDLIGEQAMARTNARDQNAMDVQKSRNEGALAGIAARTAGQEEINAAKPNKGELPTQTRVRVANKARELMNSNPELGQFLSTDSSGNFQIEQPGTSFWGSPTGPSKAQYDAIKSYVYGEETPAAAKPAKTTTPTKPTAADLIKKYGGSD